LVPNIPGRLTIPPRWVGLYLREVDARLKDFMKAIW